MTIVRCCVCYHEVDMTPSFTKANRGHSIICFDCSKKAEGKSWVE